MCGDKLHTSGDSLTSAFTELVLEFIPFLQIFGDMNPRAFVSALGIQERINVDFPYLLRSSLPAFGLRAGTVKMELRIPK